MTPTDAIVERMQKMSNTDNSAAVVPVQVKSAWLSKVNWIAGLTAAAVVLNQTTDLLQQMLPFVPAQYQHWFTAAIAIAGGLATIIVKTNFTTTISPSSAAKVS